MDATTRSCRRPACPWPATASLSYRYATAQVWLLDLGPTPNPSLYDLCATHADATTVPRGWERVDERSRKPACLEGNGDFVTAASAPQPAPPPPHRTELRGRAPNRYDRLRQELARGPAR